MLSASMRSICLLLLLILLSDTALAERRVALVIGNSAYRHAAELANPRNDATDMAAALKALGFEVTAGVDLDKAGMDGKLRSLPTGSPARTPPFSSTRGTDCRWAA